MNKYQTVHYGRNSWAISSTETKKRASENSLIQTFVASLLNSDLERFEIPYSIVHFFSSFEQQHVEHKKTTNDYDNTYIHTGLISKWHEFKRVEK